MEGTMNLSRSTFHQPFKTRQFRAYLIYSIFTEPKQKIIVKGWRNEEKTVEKLATNKLLTYSTNTLLFYDVYCIF